MSVGNFKREISRSKKRVPSTNLTNTKNLLRKDPERIKYKNQETHPKIQGESINKPRRHRLEPSPPRFNHRHLLRYRHLSGLFFLSSWFEFCSSWLGFKVSGCLGFVLRGLGFVLRDFWVSR